MENLNRRGCLVSNWSFWFLCVPQRYYAVEHPYGDADEGQVGQQGARARENVVAESCYDAEDSHNVSDH